MAKYRRVRAGLLAEGDLTDGHLRVPEAATDAQLELVHTPEYVQKVRTGTIASTEERRIGFPWSPELVERSVRSVGATIAAARAATENGVAVTLAGGTHHAYADRGEGFCVFNDVAVAARVLQAEQRVRRVVVLDCDVHQGNGTAAVFRDDPTVYTLSIFAAGNFPFRKETSDLDIPLPDGTADGDYLARVAEGVAAALDAANADIAFFLAGADPFRGDRLGRLAISREGLRERDRTLFSLCRGRGLPVAVTMAGGYARDIEDTVNIHIDTVREALRWAAAVSAQPRREEACEW
jgi:acetoin utilization deacetylase AcuC-like enzyme